jgi:hypothetical protein
MSFTWIGGFIPQGTGAHFWQSIGGGEILHPSEAIFLVLSPPASPTPSKAADTARARDLTSGKTSGFAVTTDWVDKCLEILALIDHRPYMSSFDRAL